MKYIKLFEQFVNEVDDMDINWSKNPAIPALLTNISKTQNDLLKYIKTQKKLSNLPLKNDIKRTTSQASVDIKTLWDIHITELSKYFSSKLKNAYVESTWIGRDAVLLVRIARMKNRNWQESAIFSIRLKDIDINDLFAMDENPDTKFEANISFMAAEINSSYTTSTTNQEYEDMTYSIIPRGNISTISAKNRNTYPRIDGSTNLLDIFESLKNPNFIKILQNQVDSCTAYDNKAQEFINSSEQKTYENFVNEKKNWNDPDPYNIGDEFMYEFPKNKDWEDSMWSSLKDWMQEEWGPNAGIETSKGFDDAFDTVQSYLSDEGYSV